MASTWVFGLGVYGFLAKTKKYFQAGKMGFSFFAVDTFNRSSVFSYLTDLTI
jgi:hypothetical protein